MADTPIATPVAAAAERSWFFAMQQNIKSVCLELIQQRTIDLATSPKLGDMAWYDGANWQLTGGTPGEGDTLQFLSGVPTWAPP